MYKVFGILASDNKINIFYISIYAQGNYKTAAFALKFRRRILHFTVPQYILTKS